VPRRRNDAAPALARTRMPSCATRLSFTAPALISAATLALSSSSNSAWWSMRKSLRLWWFTCTPPLIQR